MTLYEIKAELENAILNCIDEETGEILDIEKMNEIEEQYEAKIDAIISIIKSKKAEALAIKNEEDALNKRRKHLEKEAESLASYLDSALAGEKFKNERHSVSYRASKSVQIDMDAFLKNEDADLYLNYKAPEPNKTAIKKAIESGIVFDGAEIIEKMNIQIK